MEEALQIQRESEIIELTGWPFDVYDQQPAGRLAHMMTYISMKHVIEREKQELDSSRGGRH